MAFDAEVVQAICSYMNTDPMESRVTIVQGLGPDPTVEEVEMLGFDEDGADFRATSPTGTVECRIPWAKRISERAEVRVQLMALLDKAVFRLAQL